MANSNSKKRSTADYESDSDIQLSLSLSLSSSRWKAQRTAASAMPDDILLEIITRLPLEKAVQCSLINKSIRHWVSHPQFLRRHAAVFNCSATTPKLYSRIHSEFTSPASVFEILERETSILASCGGLLLLRLNHTHCKNLHIFNPMTGAVMPLDCPNYAPNRFGLAVDPDVAGSSFKVVAADVGTARSDQTVLEINVYVPCDDGLSMCLESRTQFLVGRSFTLAADHNIRPVYQAGTMFWLGDNGGVTVAFDVEKQHVSVTNGPLSEENRTRDKWFGLASGSIRLVHAMQEEILIYGHDHERGVWRVDHRIEKIGQGGDKYGMTCNFDGDRLLFLVRTLGADGAVHVYDVATKKWEKRCVFSGWADAGQHFFFFSPTTIKVSNIYLKEKKKKKKKMMNYYRKMDEDHDHPGLLDTLVGLQRLLIPKTN